MNLIKKIENFFDAIEERLAERDRQRRGEFSREDVDKIRQEMGLPYLKDFSEKDLDSLVKLKSKIQKGINNRIEFQDIRMEIAEYSESIPYCKKTYKDYGKISFEILEKEFKEIKAIFRMKKAEFIFNSHRAPAEKADGRRAM